MKRIVLSATGVFAVVLVVAAAYFAREYYFAFKYSVPVQKADQLLKEKKYSEARKLLEPIADEYHQATSKLALIYAAGLDATPDRDRVDRLLQRVVQLKAKEGFSYRLCDETVGDLAIEYHYLAEDLENVNAVKSKEYADHASALGFEEPKCKNVLY